MEGSSLLSFSCSPSSSTYHFSSKTHLRLASSNPTSACFSYSSSFPFGKCQFWNNSKRKESGVSFPTGSFRASAALVVEKSSEKSREKEMTMPKIDKSGRFCSPRAARELALMTIYASCLEGSDPVRLFEKRLNARREPGYEFDKTSLLEYNHMGFGGPPVKTETLEEADELQRADEKESAVEAEVLSAPPKLVYSKLLLRFTRKLLVAVVDKWDSHVLAIDRFAPPNWKDEPTGRILEFCILHLAMSEITVLGTRHQIVINEAVDLAKRFCDGVAPRVINGCLRSFVEDLSGAGLPRPFEANQKLEV